MTSGTQVGSIYTTYGLDLNPLRRAAQEAKQIARQLEADAGALAARQRPIKLIDGAGAASDARALKQAAQEADRALKSAERLEKQMRRTADSEIAAARATGDYARALDLVNRELGAAGNDQVRYNQLLTRQAQITRQVTQETERLAAEEKQRQSGGGGRLGQIGDAIGIGGPAALATAGVAATAAFAANASQQATAYKQASDGLRILAGSTQRYNELLVAARQNQILFGGSITENLDPLQQLIFISNRAGVQLSQLNETAKLLGATNTQEGIQGAGFAIGEFLSGDTTSIVERFNLPRGAINDLKNEEIDAAEKLRRLNELILTQGDVAEVLAQRLEGPQAQVNKLNQQIERLTLAAGEQINSLLGVGAEFVNSTNIIERYADAVERGISFQQFQIELFQGLINPASQVAQATQAAADAQTNAAESAGKQDTAAKSLIDTTLAEAEAQNKAANEAALLDQFHRDLAGISAQVAAGHITVAEGAEQLRIKYGGAADEAARLIGLQDQVANAPKRRLATPAQATRQLVPGGVDLDAPGRRGTSDDQIDDVVKAIQEQKEAEEQAAKDLADARARQVETFETTAQRVARLRKEESDALKRNGKESAEYVNAVTARRQAEKELADEQERAAAKGAKAATSGARASSTALNTIENRYEDHARKMRQIQEDYQQDAARSQEDFLLGQSRDREDFERQYRRLLAEGKRFEAAQLKETFEREQSREQQDFDRKRQRAAEDVADRQARESEDLGLDTGRTRERAALRGVRVPGGSPQIGASGPSAGPVPSGSGALAPGAGGGAIRLQIQIAPLAVQVDGQTIGVAAWPTIEQLIDTSFSEDLITVQIAAPPQPDGNPLSGPRP